MSLVLARRCRAVGLLGLVFNPLQADTLPVEGRETRPPIPQPSALRPGPLLELRDFTQPSTAILAQRLDALIAPVAELAAIGVCVRSLDRGDELYDRNAEAAFVPASNQKLLVAAAALDLLGPASSFTTELLALGRRQGSVLDGDLILRGGGDPTLTTEDIVRLADRVVTGGIRRVTGRVRGDDSFFDRQRLGMGWSWDDEPFAYAAPISALALNRNGVQVLVRPAARPGLPPSVRIEPEGTPSTLRLRAVTAPPGEPSTLRVYRTRAREEIVVTGRLPLDGEPVTAHVTVEDPPLYAASVFTALLRDRGVQVNGTPIALGTPAAAVLLHDLRSPPLTAIVRTMNKASDNLIAETLLKALGADRTQAADRSTRSPQPQSRLQNPQSRIGRLVLRDSLERFGLRSPALVIADGSGLSRQNLISPRNLVRLLVAMDRHPAREVFFDSLPVAGVDGTLRRRMVGMVAAGAVRAKTGTLSHVTALSGVAKTRDGERLAFSILTNNYPGLLTAPGGPRMMEDAIAAELVGFRRG